MAIGSDKHAILWSPEGEHERLTWHVKTARKVGAMVRMSVPTVVQCIIPTTRRLDEEALVATGRVVAIFAGILLRRVVSATPSTKRPDKDSCFGTHE